MALQSFTITVGAQVDINSKNYVAGQIVYIKKLNGTLANIYSDLGGLSPIPQDGFSNVTNSDGQFTFYIETGEYNAESGGKVTPITVVGSDYFTSKINEVVLELSKSRGFRVVGDFASGFTYELPNDVGVDGSGNYWIYSDVSALPVTVSTGTAPSSPTYTQVTFNDALGVSYPENGNVDAALRKRASYYTLAEAQAANLEIGQSIVVIDYDYAHYNVVADADAGGLYLPYKAGFKFKLSPVLDEVHASHYGVATDNPQNAVLLEDLRSYVAISKLKLVLSGDIKTSTTISLLDVKSALFNNARILPQFDGTAVSVAPSSGVLVEEYEWKGTLRVVWTATDYTTNRIGFFLQNMYNCEMSLSCHKAFRGIYCNGNETGFVHNDIYIKDMFSNFTDVYLTTSTANGWCNSNRFHGGFFYGSGDFAALPNASEAAHIYIDDSSGYKPNGNRFINPSLEWVGNGKMMANLAGLRNRIEIQYTEVNNTGGGARLGAWFVDRGENNVWDLKHVPYIIGYEEGGASNRLDISAATAPWIEGTQGYYDLQGLGSQHYKTTGPRPAIKCEGTESVITASNTSSGALPSIEVLGPAGQSGVSIPAAGIWIVFNGSIKVGWNFVAAPTTGQWRRGDIVFNVTPSAGGYAGWICVAGDGTDAGTWKGFGAIEA